MQGEILIKVRTFLCVINDQYDLAFFESKPNDRLINSQTYVFLYIFLLAIHVIHEMIRRKK